ncbi:MAG: transketolase [Patescibacteria group bacterium]|jgi:transketolase
MPTLSIAELKKQTNLIRQDIILMLERAGSGHPAGALGLADIFTILYFQILNHTPHKPNSPLRDRLILSCGHYCPVLYATLARAGYFPLVELKTLRKINSRLQGHPHNLSLPGVENSSGPLGQGISQAVGMALAGKIDKAKHHIFCITSDAEHNEGQLWEAVLLANKYHLNNLTNIVDCNGIQIDGKTNDIMPLLSLRKKYESFGWKVLEMNGHNYGNIITTIKQAKNYQKGPVVILAKTIPGKGVSFMENKYEWHGKAPNKEQAEYALHELKQAI